MNYEHKNELNEILILFHILYCPCLASSLFDLFLYIIIILLSVLFVILILYDSIII